LLAGRDRTAIPALIAAVLDAAPSHASRADDLLSCVAGPRAPRVVFEDAPPARRRCHAAWAAWWRANGRVDLARADVDLPPFNATLRGRQAARRFLAAFLQGDQEALPTVVEAPFLLGDRVFPQAPDLVNSLAQMSDARKEAGPAPPAFLLRSGEGVARIGSAAEQAFLKRFPRGELRALLAVLPAEATGTKPINATILIRLSGQQARVVGFIPDNLAELTQFSR
jgi:hypothetical protein